jgi:hypothetical protein
MSVRVPAWSRTELDVMRIGLGFVAITTFSRISFFRPAGEPSYPVGIARVVNLKWVGSPRTVRWLQFAAYAAALCYAANRLVPWALLVLTVALLLDLTFRSSHGSVNHGDHLLAVVLVALTAATGLWNAAELWNWKLGGVLAKSQEATAAWWAVQAILAVYFTSGLSKLINTRGRWISRSPGLLLSYSARAETDRMMGAQSWGSSGKSETLVAWLFERPGVAKAGFAAGLVIELAAPVGVFGDTALLVVGIALLALHKANGRLLGLPFPQYQLLVLTYLVNAPRIFR